MVALRAKSKALMKKYFVCGELMDNYRVTVGIEPANDYDKAKQDVMQAMASFGKLPQHLQRKLAEELVGAANVAKLLTIFNQAIGR